MHRAVLFAAAILVAGCSSDGDADAAGTSAPASGSGTSRSYAVTGFDTIDLRGSDDVDVRVGSGFSVRAEGPSDTLDRLRIVRDGTVLRIGRRNASGLRWSDGDDVRILVTMPRIVRARIAGSGDMAIDRVEGARFDADIAGSGGLKLAAIQVDEAAISVAGSGGAKAAGSARRLVVDIAGSGNLDARDLKAQTAKVSVAGSGNVRADVTGTATVSVAGSGSADLGSARCTTRIAGSGTVKCRDG